MKKLSVIATLFVFACSAANAQSGLLGALKGVGSQLLQNAISGTVAESDFQIDGTWNYNGVAVATSSDNVISNLAGSALSGTVENKIDGYLQKVGIKPGVASLTFGKDYNFNMSMGKVPLNGTWQQEGSKITLKFGKSLTYLQLDGVIKQTVGGCEILFDADKFMQFAEKAATYAAKITGSSTASTLSALMNQVSGLDAGFKLVK